MKAIIIGITGDIGREMALRLVRDGWEVAGTGRDTCDLTDRESIYQAVEILPSQWDLLIVAAGTMEPIGRFVEEDSDDWERCVQINALGPLRLFRYLYPYRAKGARVVFFDGPNLSKPTPTYSAYRAGKALLAAMIPTLREECPDIDFTITHTGVVDTKIHHQTMMAGDRAANYDRVRGIIEGREKTTSFDEVYRMVT